MTTPAGDRSPAEPRYTTRRRQVVAGIAVLVVLLLGAGAGAAAGTDEELRQRWGAFVTDYERDRDRLRAEELCATTWVPLAEEVDALAEALGPRRGKRRAQQLLAGLGALELRLATVTADCGEHLLERYRLALQGHRDLEILCSELLLAGRVPTRLRDRLELVQRSASEILVRADGRDAERGDAVFLLEASEHRLRTALIAADPCTERLAELRVELRVDATELSAQQATLAAGELCRLAASGCLWPPHHATVHRLLGDLAAGPGGDLAVCQGSESGGGSGDGRDTAAGSS